MRIALLSLATVLTAAPLAAEAAAPTRWSVTLEARITQSFSYARTSQEEDCVANRLGSEEHVATLRSARPTVIAVTRLRNRAQYSPAAIARVRTTETAGERWWTERRRCRAGPLETRSGTCAPSSASRLVRTRFRWAGANRIWFQSRGGVGRSFRLCGLDRDLRETAWLDLAIGRVDEQALLAGSARRVVARGTAERSGNVVSEQDLSVGTSVKVRWTLTFRRLR